MKIEFTPVVRVTIDEFAEKHGLVMEVREYDTPRAHQDRFSAAFKHVKEIREGYGFHDTKCYGGTPEDAIASYAAAISGLTLIFDDPHREIEVPALLRTPGLGRVYPPALNNSGGQP